MKQIFIFISLFFMLSACNSQNRIDLEEVDFNTYTSTLLKVEHQEEKSTVGWKPGYWIYDMDKFCFGDILFSSGGERGPDDIPASKIELTLDTAKTRLIVVSIIIEKSEESQHFIDYLYSKYDKPITLKEDPKPNRDSEIMGHSAVLWKNALSGRSLILAKNYSIKNDRSAFSVILHIVKNNDPEIFVIDYDGNKMNALEYLVLRHAHDYAAVKKFLKEE